MRGPFPLAGSQGVVLEIVPGLRVGNRKPGLIAQAGLRK